MLRSHDFPSEDWKMHSALIDMHRKFKMSKENTSAHQSSLLFLFSSGREGRWHSRVALAVGRCQLPVLGHTGGRGEL